MLKQLTTTTSRQVVGNTARLSPCSRRVQAYVSFLLRRLGDSRHTNLDWQQGPWSRTEPCHYAGHVHETYHDKLSEDDCLANGALHAFDPALRIQIYSRLLAWDILP